MKRFDVVTLFPGMFDALTNFGITQRAYDRGQFELVLWNPREFAQNAYRSVDDRPYGGGPGMVMMADPLAKALRAAKARQGSCGVRNTRTVFLSPQGRVLDQVLVEELAQAAQCVQLRCPAPSVKRPHHDHQCRQSAPATHHRARSFPRPCSYAIHLRRRATIADIRADRRSCQ